MKYIDAEKLLAEIERRLIRYDPDYTSAGSELKGLLSFIDSLQQEQLEVDIRKELDGLELMGSNDARDIQTIARHFYELGLNARKV